MSQPVFPVRLLSALLLALIVGCDRQGGSNTSTDPATLPDSGVPIKLALEVTPITPLLPRLKTHVAVDARGNLYWVQESEPTPEGGDLVFVMGDSGVPQTIPALAVPRLLAALGLEGVPARTASIRSIAVGPANDLYVLITGGAGRSPIWAIARYTPATASVKIVLGTRRIMEESGMGASIDLARGTLISQGADLWLWLRHSDAARVMRLVSTDGGNTIELRPLHLKPPPEAASRQLSSEQEDLAAGPGQSLYYLDRPHAILWKIDSAGEYTAIQSLDQFSSAMTAPAVDRAGHIFLIAGDADPLVATESSAGSLATIPKSAAPTAWVQLAYPAFLQIELSSAGAASLTTIKRDDFVGPAALPLQDLQPRQLLLDPTHDTLITFDAASGELLRLKIAPR